MTNRFRDVSNVAPLQALMTPSQLLVKPYSAVFGGHASLKRVFGISVQPGLASDWEGNTARAVKNRNKREDAATILCLIFSSR